MREMLLPISDHFHFALWPSFRKSFTHILRPGYAVQYLTRKRFLLFCLGLMRCSLCLNTHDEEALVHKPFKNCQLCDGQSLYNGDFYVK